MQYRQLGRSGLKISPICLGTMMFGGPTDEATSSRIIAKAREAGINFIDSADAYNGGQSEVVVGRAISNNRQNWILATKLANQIGDDPNRGGLSRRWVMQAAEESLRRLGTDHIDIYYLHKEDHATPLQETVRAMGDLIRQGKIRYFGVSNYRAWRVAEICNICDDNGIDRPIVSQPYYNAMNRMPEVEHFPACGYYGLGIVPYSPLARGVLTGKYQADAPPDKETRAGRNDTRMMQTEWRPESIRLAQEIRRHAEARGITAGQFAVSWVLNSSFVSGVLMVSVGFSAGHDTGIWAIIIYFGVQNFDGYVVIPMVARRTVDMPPALTLASQILASSLFGVLGLALADPMVAMIKVAMERESELAARAAGEDDSGDDPVQSLPG